MPGAFDYSKWDNLDTSSSDDEPAADGDATHLREYGRSHGMDDDLIADTLGQCGGDAGAALEYLRDFMEMGEGASAAAQAGGAREARVERLATDKSGAAARGGAGEAGPGSGGGGGGAGGGGAEVVEDRWELEEELVSGRQQIAVSLTTPCTPLRLLLSGHCCASHSNCGRSRTATQRRSARCRASRRRVRRTSGATCGPTGSG